MNYRILSFEATELVGHIMKKMAAYGISPKSVSIALKGEQLFPEQAQADCTIFIGGGEAVKKAVEQQTGQPLVQSSVALSAYEKRLRATSTAALSPKAVTKLTSFPRDFEVFESQRGLECSAIYFKGKKSIVLLPSEMTDARAFFDNIALPRISEGRKNAPLIHEFKLFGADADEIKRKTDALPPSKSYSVYFDVDYKTDALLSISFTAKADQEAQQDIIARVCELFADYIYAHSDISLEQRAVELLKLRKKKVSVAESLTGGLICAQLVNVSGSSQAFDEGFVTYADSSKVKHLGVRDNTIKKHGAVSDQTAYEMALGLLNQGCDVAIATTGIAGPTGATIDKPLGLCYTAVGSREGIHIYKRVYTGDRNSIREQVASAALFSLIKLLL